MPSRSQSLRVPSSCPDCGGPLKRFATIGRDMAITEKALRCERCRQFLRRATTYGRTTFVATTDPRIVVAKAIEVAR